jgi:hypothetical protein
MLMGAAWSVTSFPQRTWAGQARPRSRHTPGQACSKTFSGRSAPHCGLCWGMGREHVSEGAREKRLRLVQVRIIAL